MYRERVESIDCPYCGEPGEIELDPGEMEAGEHRFVQDCPVCCHPWAVTVRVQADGGLSVEVARG